MCLYFIKEKIKGEGRIGSIVMLLRLELCKLWQALFGERLSDIVSSPIEKFAYSNFIRFTLHVNEHWNMLAQSWSMSEMEQQRGFTRATLSVEHDHAPGRCARQIIA